MTNDRWNSFLLAVKDNQELFSKLKDVQTKEQVLKLAEQYGIELQMTDLESAGDKKNKSLSDQQLEKVAGGSGSLSCPKCNSNNLGGHQWWWTCNSCGHFWPI